MTIASPTRGEIVIQEGKTTPRFQSWIEAVSSGGSGTPINPPIAPGTHTKITYDSNGLVLGGTNATTTDIPEGTNLYYTEGRVVDLIEDFIFLGIGT